MTIVTVCCATRWGKTQKKRTKVMPLSAEAENRLIGQNVDYKVSVICLDSASRSLTSL